MEKPCIIVPTQDAQKAKKVLKSLEVWDKSRRMIAITDSDKVAIPIITRDHDSSRLLSLVREKMSSTAESALAIMELDLPAAKKLLVKSPLKIVLEGLTILFEDKGVELTEGLRIEVPDHWERHGDLILLPDSAFVSEVWNSFGEGLWQIVCSSLECKRIARKTVISQDGYRSPQVVVLYGSDSWVEHIDNGIRYSYDVTKCMFSSGNITEKLRVSRFDCAGETVVDLYAGIGYFTLPYLMYTGAKHLHACEWNPDAVEALRRNLQLNGVADRCTVHVGDNRKVCPQNVADRVNLGLIPSSEPGWRTACLALRQETGGVLHIHGNVNTRSGQGENIILGNKTGNDKRKETNSSHSENLSFSEIKPLYEDYFTEQKDKIGDTEADSDLHTDITRYSTKVDEAKIENKMKEVDVPKAYQLENDLKTNAYESFIKADGEEKLEMNIKTDSCSSCFKDAVDTTDNVNILKDGQIIKINENDMQVENRVTKSKWLPWATGVSVNIMNILREVHGGDWNTQILHIEHIKSYAPFVDHVVLDLKCCPLLK